MKINFYVVGFTSLLFIYSSCGKEFQEMNEPKTNESSCKTIQDTSSNNDPYIILGEEREIAYTVENLQRAVELISKNVPSSPLVNKRIEPSHLYLRFLPSTNEHLETLFKLSVSRKLILSNYPLHFQIIKQGSFLMQDDPEKIKFAPQYTTAPLDFNLPDVPYEVIANVYQPTADESDLEVAALVMTKNEDVLKITLNGSPLSSKNLVEFLKLPESEKGSKYTPKGRFVVWDTRLGSYVPVKNTFVNIGRVIWWSDAYVDNNGYYTCGETFRYSVSVKATWVANDFTIRKHWNEVIGIGLSDYLLSLSSSDNNRTYLTKLTDNHLWYKATVSNSINKYNSNMIHKGVHNVSNTANIWVQEGNHFRGATPMAKYYTWSISYNALLADWLTWLSPVSFPIVTVVNALVGHLYPDMIISVNTKNTKKIDQLIFHEAGHFSHARKASGSFWGVFVNRELDNILDQDGDPYCDGTMPTVWSGQLIALCEGWATFTEYINMRDYYGTDYQGFNASTYIEDFTMRSVPSTINEENNGWFLSGLIWDIIDNQAETSYLSRYVNNNILPPTSTPITDNLSLGSLNYTLSYVYNNLTSSTSNANDLKLKLLSSYPSSSNQINQLFQSYGY